MPLHDTIDEQVIPPRLRRPLAALWFSLSVHAALIALVQVAPPESTRLAGPVMEARLVSTRAVGTPPPAVAADDIRKTVPQFAAGEAAGSLPVAETVTPSSVEPYPPDDASRPDVPPAEAQPAPVSPAASAPSPAVAVASAVDLGFYSARDLDVQPRALREIVPDYPADADRQRLSGRVRLQLQLEADGRVIDAEVVSATPAEVFDESAIKALREARFAPAQRNGRPVRARVTIEVVYDWEGRR